MEKAIVLPLKAIYLFPNGMEIEEVGLASKKLTIFIHNISNNNKGVIRFKNPIGFRIFDEQDLIEYWPIPLSPQEGIFEVLVGGWLSREHLRTAIPSYRSSPNSKEFLITGRLKCVSVLSSVAPTLSRSRPQPVR
jgi:hypothetical protein